MTYDFSIREDTYQPLDGPIPEYRPLHKLKDIQPIRATCFHPSGDVFLVGSNSKTLRICIYPPRLRLKNFISDDEPNEPDIAFKLIQLHQGSIYCAKFNDKGNLFATGSNDQTVHVVRYNPEDRVPQGNEYKLTMHNGTVRDLCFTGGEQAQYLISGGAGDYGIYITDCATMKPIQMLKAHEANVMSLHTWSDPATFVSGSLDGSILIWDLRMKRYTSRIKATSDYKQQSVSDVFVTDNENHTTKPVGVVRVDPSGKLLVSGHRDGTCMFYDIRGGRIVQMFKAHDDEIRTLNFSSKCYYLLTASYDRKVKLVDIQGDLTRKLPSVEIAELDDKVVQTAWHPTDINFVTTCADGSAILWAIPNDNLTGCNNTNDYRDFSDTTYCQPTFI